MTAGEHWRRFWWLVAIVSVSAAPLPLDATPPPVATFSIVAYDAETGDLGVAVQSKFFAVGAVVPYAAAGVGAIATQSYANTTYGPEGLELLRGGRTADEVVALLTEADPEREERQLGVVDAAGNPSSFTGESCWSWAGGRTGERYAAQGNILAGPQVIDAMATAYETTEGDLASRLLAALTAGQAAGGDARGRQSAALLVVREAGGYGGFSDRYIDLRVDAHPTPIRELQRLLDMRHAQIETSTARRLLAEAAETVSDDPDRRLAAARRAAEQSVALDPNNAGAWLVLAAVRLEQQRPEPAAAAGKRALLLNPWLKTAILTGLSDEADLVDRLLAVESFRQLWETLPVTVRPG